MCEDCGCGVTDSIKGHERETETVRVIKGLLDSNDRQARHNREHFDRHGVFSINLMSSPGAGKTRLLEATAEALEGRFRMAVIEGDLETENDAARLRARGIPAVQITTGSACHLDAGMVHRALHQMSLDDVDLLFIENVGNLVCPASFDLGQHQNVVLLSVTEGDDKPAKYPVMFRAADLVALSKSDLLDYMEDFEPDRARRALADLGVDVPVIETSSGRAKRIDDWLEWLNSALARRPARTQASRPSTGHLHPHAEV